MTPLLTIVLIGRKPDPGGAALARMRLCAASVAEGVQRFQLPTELLTVEWNPPADSPGLAKALDLPRNIALFQWRVVTIPRKMAGKCGTGGPMPALLANIGVRRAKGEFILVASTDCLFPLAVFDTLKRIRPDPACFYLADRLDIAEPCDVAELAPKPREALLRRAARRVHTAQGASDIRSGAIPASVEGDAPQAVPVLSPEDVFTATAGDFIMASQAAWSGIGGFPETTGAESPTAAMCCLRFLAAGLRQCVLPGSCAIFRLSHPQGTPDHPDACGTGEARNGEDAYDAMLAAMAAGEDVLSGASPDWGLAGARLPESSNGDGSGLIFLWPKSDALIAQHEAILRRTHADSNAIARFAERARLMRTQPRTDDVLRCDDEACTGFHTCDAPVHVPDDCPLHGTVGDTARNVASQYFPVPVTEGTQQQLRITLGFAGADEGNPIQGRILIQDELMDVHCVRDFTAVDGTYAFATTLPELVVCIRLILLPAQGNRQVPPVPTSLRVVSDAITRSFFATRYWFRKFTRLAAHTAGQREGA